MAIALEAETKVTTTRKAITVYCVPSIDQLASRYSKETNNISLSSLAVRGEPLGHPPPRGRPVLRSFAYIPVGGSRTTADVRLGSNRAYDCTDTDQYSAEIVVVAPVRIRYRCFNTVYVPHVIIRIITSLDFADELGSGHVGAGVIVIKFLILPSVAFLGDGYSFSSHSLNSFYR